LRIAFAYKESEAQAKNQMFAHCICIQGVRGSGKEEKKGITEKTVFKLKKNLVLSV
jgi:hypothetical protein